MSSFQLRGVDAGCRWVAAAVLLLVLAIPVQALAQQSGERGSERRFAVGGGVLYGGVLCYDCNEPGFPGASGGFEVRINENWSFVAEGVWYQGYDVRSIERDGVTHLTFRHDYFASFEAKIRWQFSSLRHRPYLVFGAVATWDHDTSFPYGGRLIDGRWVVNFDDVEVQELLDVGGGALVGFGWAFKVGERFEIRPEASVQLANPSLPRIGVTGWFNF